MKNYNDQLDEKGTSAFLMRRNITKQGAIRAGFVYVPSKEKAEAIAKKCDSQFIPSADSYIVIRNDLIVMTIEKSGRIATGDFSHLTKRGRRLYEKLIEGAIDYLTSFHKIENYEKAIDATIQVMPDCFQGKGAQPLTIDDLLDL